MALEIKGVTKSYKKTQALTDINLDFEEGKIYGLLGRNGAGKSTLLKIITNRIFADSGSITMNGKSVFENDKIQSRIYLMNENSLYPQKMKIKEAFKWSKEFYPDFDMKYALKLADAFKLDINKRVHALSTGYNSIFKIIIALSVNTPFVFLDEPVLGLDANHRDLFYKLLVEKYAENPFCCVISTHLIEEVSSVIEDVIIIKEGKVIKNQPIEEILQSGFTVSGNAAKIDEFIKDKNVIGTDSIGGLKTAYILESNVKNIPDELEISPLDLQKLFVQLTNS